MRGARTSPCVGAHDAGLDRRSPRVPSWIVTPEPLDRQGQAAHQARRVDRRAVRRVRRPEDVGGTEHARAPRRPSSSVKSLGAEAPRPVPPRSRPAPASSCTGVRASTTVPPLRQWQSMPSLGGDAPDLVDRVEHRPLQGDGASRGDDARDLAPATSGTAPSPAAVAAARAEAGGLRLERRRRAATGRPWRGSRRSTARCSRRRRSRRRPTSVPGSAGRAVPTSSSGSESHQSESRR